MMAGIRHIKPREQKDPILIIEHIDLFTKRHQLVHNGGFPEF